MQRPPYQADANFKTEKAPAKVQNNFPDAPEFLPKRAEFERLNFQVADLQWLTLNEQGEGGEKWQRNRKIQQEKTEETE
jgi:hypothetical protein